jgi:hypothetical protein
MRSNTQVSVEAYTEIVGGRDSKNDNNNEKLNTPGLPLEKCREESRTSDESFLIFSIEIGIGLEIAHPPPPPPIDIGKHCAAPLNADGRRPSCLVSSRYSFHI